MNTHEIQRRIRSLSPHDFDGHTRYTSMTAEQRLQWLSEASRFWWTTHRPKTDRRERSWTPTSSSTNPPTQ